MKLEHGFEVAAPVEAVWTLLLDLERVAACLPGARLGERLEDGGYRATIMVKVGPMQMSYQGEITIVEHEEEARRAVMKAKGREVRGQGSAEALITTSLESANGGTKASMSTDLRVTGRVAQLGHGAVQEVSNRLLDQFVACLVERLQAAPSDSAAARTPAAERGVAPEVVPINALRLLLDVARAKLGRILRRADPPPRT